MKCNNPLCAAHNTDNVTTMFLQLVQKRWPLVATSTASFFRDKYENLTRRADIEEFEFFLSTTVIHAVEELTVHTLDFMEAKLREDPSMFRAFCSVHALRGYVESFPEDSSPIGYLLPDEMSEFLLRSLELCMKTDRLLEVQQATRIVFDGLLEASLNDCDGKTGQDAKRKPH